MAWQLVYTSAPRLLDAGRSGFGTVARHRAIPSLVVQAVERFSQFARLPGMDPTRVIHSHRVLLLSGARYHVLSMIRSAGSDYTGRTNHIAHHLIVTDHEAAECTEAGVTPADVLISYPWLMFWDAPPRFLEDAEQPDLAVNPVSDLEYSAWGQITGNPQHALLLVTHPAGNGCRLLAPLGTDFRFLFLESLRWQMATAWHITFTTAEEPNDDVSDFRWIVTIAAPRPATLDSGRPLLDLTLPEFLPFPELPLQAEEETTVPSPALHKLGQYREPGTHAASGPAPFQLPPPTFTKPFQPASAPPRPQVAPSAKPALKASPGPLNRFVRASAFLLATALLIFGGMSWWNSSHPAEKNYPPSEEPIVQKQALAGPLEPANLSSVESIKIEPLPASTLPSPVPAQSGGTPRSPTIAMPARMVPPNAEIKQIDAKASAEPRPYKAYFISDIRDLHIPISSSSSPQISVILKDDSTGEAYPLKKQFGWYYLGTVDMSKPKFFSINNQFITTPIPPVERRSSVKEVRITLEERPQDVVASAFIFDSLTNKSTFRGAGPLLDKTYAVALKNTLNIEGDFWSSLIFQGITPRFTIRMPNTINQRLLDFLHSNVIPEHLDITYDDKHRLLTGELRGKLDSERKIRTSEKNKFSSNEVPLKTIWDRKQEALNKAIDKSKKDQDKKASKPDAPPSFQPGKKKSNETGNSKTIKPPDQIKDASPEDSIDKLKKEVDKAKIDFESNQAESERLAQYIARLSELINDPFFGGPTVPNSGVIYDVGLFIGTAEQPQMKLHLCNLTITPQ